MEKWLPIQADSTELETRLATSEPGGSSEVMTPRLLKKTYDLIQFRIAAFLETVVTLPALADATVTLGNFALSALLCWVDLLLT